jgi:signal-transduction protein with cAMP-binding, CBS, and nucleotidyltransferase domain
LGSSKKQKTTVHARGKFGRSRRGELVSAFAQPPLLINADDAVEDAAKIMRDNQVGSVIVVEKKDRPIGIITEWDLLSRVIAEGRNVERTTVREVMTSPLIQVPADTRMSDAMRLMINRGIRRLALEEDGVLAGVITLNQMIGRRRRVSATLLPLVESVTGYRCPYCSSTFRYRKQLSEHISSTHFGTVEQNKAARRALP